jgi:hypothetical protein
MSINFPLFILLKDCGEVLRCTSVHEMQYHFEKIDVENDEYAAWDSNGVPVRMSVQEPVWLRLDPGEGTDLNGLMSALSNYARQEKIALDAAACSTNQPERVYEAIRKELDGRRSTKRSFWPLFGKKAPR